MAAKHDILMVGQDTQPFLDISDRLDDGLYAVSFAQARDPLRYLLEHKLWHSAGMIVQLTGSERVDDLVPVFEAFPQTSFLFLQTHQPVDSALELIASRYGAQLLDPATQSPSQIVEDLLALMFHRKLR